MGKLAKTVFAYFACYSLLSITAFAGRQGPGDFVESTTTLQRVCSVAVTVYGILGAIALIGLALKKQWTLPVIAGWSLATTIAATTAPIAWSDEPVPWWAVLLGGVTTALIGYLIFLLARILINGDSASDTVAPTTP